MIYLLYGENAMEADLEVVDKARLEPYGRRLADDGALRWVMRRWRG